MLVPRIGCGSRVGFRPFVVHPPYCRGGRFHTTGQFTLYVRSYTSFSRLLFDCYQLISCFGECLSYFLAEWTVGWLDTLTVRPNECLSNWETIHITSWPADCLIEYLADKPPGWFNWFTDRFSDTQIDQLADQLTVFCRLCAATCSVHTFRTALRIQLKLNISDVCWTVRHCDNWRIETRCHFQFHFGPCKRSLFVFI